MLMLIGNEELPFEEDPELWEKIEEPQARRLVQHMLKRNPLDRWTVGTIKNNAYFSSGHDTITEPPAGEGHRKALKRLEKSILNSENALAQVTEMTLCQV